MPNLEDLMDNHSFFYIPNNIEIDKDTLLERAITIVERLVSAALLECCSTLWFENNRHQNIVNRIKLTCANDLLAFYSKDPSNVKDIEVLARSSTSYAAVLHYRLAHWIHKNLDTPESNMAKAMISRRGKLLSGAEIHCNCNIGERFVLDHGYGTVIGETSSIGNDCYILGGVTLGSRRIAHNLSEPRHPSLGDRVQIGMNVSLLGPISIGSDCFIEAGCIVSTDIIAKSRVTLSQSHTIISEKHEIYHETN